MTKELTEQEIEFVARALCRMCVSEFTADERDGHSLDEWVDDCWEDWTPEARAAIEAHKAHLSASGCVIVPREPTEKMLVAADGAEGPEVGARAYFSDEWEAALSALRPYC